MRDRTPHEDAVLEAVRQPHRPLWIVREDTSGLVDIVWADIGAERPPTAFACLPGLQASRLGDPGFCATHGVRCPYVAGEMANGIASEAMVAAMANAGMLSFYGAAGLSLPRIEQAIEDIGRRVAPGRTWGINLIHSPSEPDLEMRAVDLFLGQGITHMSASAFMALSPAVVRFSASGLVVGRGGDIERRRHVFAKVSRPEVAEHFLAPAPTALLRPMVEAGLLTEQQAVLAECVPVAEDLTVESDSAGHTDNRPLAVLLPCMQAVRDRAANRHGYVRPIRVGAAGGLAHPAAVAAAFALGADYVLTGTVNEMAAESGLSEPAREKMRKARLHDVMMAPAADMFEQGVKVQVLKLGTLFGSRAQRLYETYVRYAGLEQLPRDIVERLEKDVFRAPLDAIWKETRAFWMSRNPAQVRRAESDPKHRMALVFRWYLGNASRWAIEGDATRGVDYQIWCGPAAGAFNEWISGSFLEDPARRGVVQIALNLMAGALEATRAHQLRTMGVAVPSRAVRHEPRFIDPRWDFGHAPAGSPHLPC